MNTTETMNMSEVILYQPDSSIHLEVRAENDTVWLNRQQMALLFNRDIKTIGKHISNALRDELKEFSVVANFATTAADGKTYQIERLRCIELGNLASLLFLSCAVGFLWQISLSVQSAG